VVSMSGWWSPCQSGGLCQAGGLHVRLGSPCQTGGLCVRLGVVVSMSGWGSPCQSGVSVSDWWSTCQAGGRGLHVRLWVSVSVWRASKEILGVTAACLYTCYHPTNNIKDLKNLLKVKYYNIV